MLSVYDLEQAARWDMIVRSFGNHDIYYLSGYVRAFMLHGDGEPLLFYYEGDAVHGDEGLRGINVVMRRDIAEDKHFSGQLPKNILYDFATPYGYGGWLIEGGNDYKELFKAYSTWCESQNVVCEFVRFHPALDNQRILSNDYEIVPLGKTVLLDITDPKIIWDNLSSKNRNMIRKAEKSGVKVFHDNSEKLYGQFREIYNETMCHDNANKYYYFPRVFYMSICHDLSENAQVFYAVKETGDTIAASIILAENGYLSYHLSGSKKEYRNLAAGNLLLYKAALWGSQNGFKKFHLGGGLGSKDDDLLRFKKSFYRGDLQQFYIGRKIFMSSKYDELLKIRGEIIQSDYFPAYRADSTK